MNGQDCARCREQAPELALGLLTGRERGEVLDHLEHCPECRAEVAALTAVQDRLRTLVPPAEPPVGFETRVLDRIGVPARRVLRRRRTVRLAGAVAVAAAVFAGGWLAGGGGSPGEPAPAVAAPLTAGDRRVGDVVVERDRPEYLSVWLDVPEPGRLRCELLRPDGSVAATVVYEAAGGAEWWGVRRPVGEVSGLRIEDAAGAVVAAGPVPRT